MVGEGPWRRAYSLSRFTERALPSPPTSLRRNSAASGPSGPAERNRAARAANCASTGRRRSSSRSAQRLQQRRIERRRLPRDQGQRQPPRRGFAVGGERRRQAEVVVGQQHRQRVHGGAPPVVVHTGQQGAEQGGEDRGGAGAVFLPHEERQHAPGVRVGRRLGEEVEQVGEGRRVGAADAAEEIEVMGLAEMRFVEAGGQGRAALRADEQHLGRGAGAVSDCGSCLSPSGMTGAGGSERGGELYWEE